MLRRTTGVNEEHVREYQKLEVLRQSINKVKKDAEINKGLRKNPKGMYGNVKSKVGANIKTVNKANKDRKKMTHVDEKKGIYSLSATAKTTNTENGY